MTEQELAAIEAKVTLAHECWPEHTHHYELATDTKALADEVRRLRERLHRYGEGCDGCLHDGPCTDGCWALTRHD